MDLDERMINLEMKLTYQEDIIKTLNNIILEQEQRIKAVERSMEVVKKQLNDLGENMPGNVRPPHY